MEAVADGVLLLGRELGHGLAGRIGRQEQRVVAEAEAPAALARDRALAGPRTREHAARRVDERHDAHEAGRAVGIRHLLHLVEQLGVVGLVVAMGAGIARGVDPGLAVERIHHQAGIIGDGRQPGRRDGGLGLDDRVLDERGAVLLGVFEIPQLAECHKANVGQNAAQNRLDLGQLVGVARGDHDGALGVQGLDVDLLKCHRESSSRCVMGCVIGVGCKLHIRRRGQPRNGTMCNFARPQLHIGRKPANRGRP